jgi:tetratricopeptide (TPR) repeat protein
MKKILVLFALLLAPLSSYTQTRRPAPDPVITAEVQALQEGRKADADKILSDAILATEQSAPNSPQLALYLRSLATLRRDSDSVGTIQRAMEIDEKTYGPKDSIVAEDMYVLASILRQKQPERSEKLLKDAIDLLLHRQPPELDIISLSVAELADLYVSERRFAEATSFFEEGLKECQSANSNPYICDDFRHQLEDLYRKQGRTEDADRLLPTYRDQESVQVQELNRQARESEKNALYPQAEYTYRRAIDFVQTHPQHLFGMLGVQFDLLGQVLEKEGRDSEAEQAYLRGLEVEENAAGPKPPQSRYIQFLNFSELINLYRRKGRLQEMEPIIQRGLEIQERYLPGENQGLAMTLRTLADLYREERKFAEAKPIYERLLATQEKNPGPDNSALLPTLTSYADVLRSLHDDAAAAVQARINSLLIQSRSAQQIKPN